MLGSILQLKHEISNVRLQNNEKVQVFITRVQNLCDILKAASEKQSEQQVIRSGDAIVLLTIIIMYFTLN